MIKIPITILVDSPTRQQLETCLSQYGFKPKRSDFWYNFAQWGSDEHNHTITIVDTDLANTHTFEDAIHELAFLEHKSEYEIYQEMIAIE